MSLWEAQSSDVTLRCRGGGGIVTSLLTHTLRTGSVKQALVAASCPEPPWVRAAFARTVDEVRAAAGSKYQLVPHGQLAGELDEESAVVGLPCQMHALRGKPVGLRVGLFCGINLSWRAIAYLLRRMKVNVADIESVDYRAPGGGFLVRLRDGRVVRRPGYSWLAYFFSHEACLRCTDATSHHADISVGDRREGWSSVIVRNDRGVKCFDEATRAGCIIRREISLHDFLAMATTSVLQKELFGGYAKDPFVRVRGRWIEGVPVPVLSLIGSRIIHRHRKANRRALCLMGGNPLRPETPGRPPGLSRPESRGPRTPTCTA